MVCIWSIWLFYILLRLLKLAQLVKYLSDLHAFAFYIKMVSHFNKLKNQRDFNRLIWILFEYLQKKAVNAPLHTFRRRVVDDEKLIWEPEFDVEDSQKMGTYTGWELVIFWFASLDLIFFFNGTVVNWRL